MSMRCLPSSRILLQQAVFSYQERGSFAGEVSDELAVLRIDHLEFSSTTITCLVGPSGCGKTTLLLLLAGLLSLTSGQIQRIGCSFDDDRVGMVFQSPSLLPWASARDNALLGARIARGRGAVDQDRLRKLFLRFGLAGSEGCYPHQLSGGMAQRVAIVRALMANARVLLLDEPFSSSDLLVRRHIHDELGRIVREENLIVVLVTHDVNEAVRLSDRVVVLGSQPASVVEIIECDMPRERRLNPDPSDRVQMVELEEQVMSALTRSSQAHLCRGG